MGLVRSSFWTLLAVVAVLMFRQTPSPSPGGRLTATAMNAAGLEDGVVGGEEKDRRLAVPACNNTNDKQFPIRYELPPIVQAVSANYSREFLVASPQLKLAMTWIPKVMCTSIKNAFNLVECGTVHKRCAVARKEAGQAMLHAPLNDTTRAIFFRDPLERAYSAYSNSGDNQWIYLTGCPTRDACSFDKWVDKMVRHPREAFLNEHFRPQSTFIQAQHMHYHYYLRMSSRIDQDFFWRDLMQNRVPTQHSNTASSNGTVTAAAVHENAWKMKMKTKYADTVKASTWHKLAKLYEEDMQLWEQLLQRGTPRQPGEFTFYDYYMQEMRDSAAAS